MADPNGNGGVPPRRQPPESPTNAPRGVRPTAAFTPRPERLGTQGLEGRDGLEWRDGAAWGGNGYAPQSRANPVPPQGVNPVSRGGNPVPPQGGYIPPQPRVTQPIPPQQSYNYPPQGAYVSPPPHANPAPPQSGNAYQPQAGYSAPPQAARPTPSQSAPVSPPRGDAPKPNPHPKRVSRRKRLNVPRHRVGDRAPQTTAMPAMPGAGENARPRRRAPWRVVLICACAALFLYSGTRLALYYAERARQARDIAQAQALYHQQEDAATPETAALDAASHPDTANNPAGANAPTAADPANAPAAVNPANAKAAASPQEPRSATRSPVVSIPNDSTSAPDPSTTRSVPVKYLQNPFRDVQERFKPLYRKNNDVIGWLTITDIVDQPVVHRDNEYYINHNYLKQYNAAGAIFMDEACSIATPPENVLLHGHNMKDGSMFGRLKRYENTTNASFYLSHAYVQFDTLYENGKYVIFAVMDVSIDYTNPSFFNYFSYNTFGTDQQLIDYAAECKAHSLYNIPIEVVGSDRLLTLSTCEGGSDDRRIVLVARRVRDDEDTAALQAAIYQAKRR